MGEVFQQPVRPKATVPLVNGAGSHGPFKKIQACNLAIDLSSAGRCRVSCFRQRNWVGMLLRCIKSKISTIAAMTLPLIIVAARPLLEYCSSP